MKKIIKNLNRVENFINKISKNTSNQTSRWLNNNFKDYLLNEYDNFKVIEKNNKSQTIHIVLNKKLKEDVSIVIDYLENKKHKYLNPLQISFEQILRLKNKNLVAIFSNNSYLFEVNDSKEIAKLKTEFEFPIHNHNNQVWKITDYLDNNLAVILYSNGFINNNIAINELYFKEIPSKSLQNFYEWCQEHFNVDFYINIFNNCCFNKNIGRYYPISIWDENGILEDDLYITNVVEYLPKNLTVKGNIYMENSSLCFLGNSLKVEGNIYASNSQLAVIDDSIEVQGQIFVEDSLLMSYPTSLSNKIINPKRMKQIIRDF